MTIQMKNRKLRGLNRIEMWLVLFALASILYAAFHWQACHEPSGWMANEGDSPALEGQGGREKRDWNIPAAGEPLRFVSYNVFNYFVHDVSPSTGRKLLKKSEQSRQAVADTIMKGRPDMVGLAEVGGVDALEDLKERLKKAGGDFPFSIVLNRPGEDRQLAFLSRFPIGADNSRTEVPLDRGKRKTMLRGILDIVVDIPDGRKFRFVGVHLKSKKDSDGTADMLRRMEAHTLREYLTATDEGLPLLVYGDFNDGPDSPAVQTVLGDQKGANGLKRVVPRDANRETWTLHYAKGEAYFSYDHVLMNKDLQKRLGRNFRKGILGGAESRGASDHRAVWIELK